MNDAISSRRVRVNGRVVWMSSWMVERGDRIDVLAAPADATDLVAFDPAWLIADRGDYVVVDKPSGLRSEAVRATDETPNLLTLAREEFGTDLVLAHRLDRDTSGLVVLTRPGYVRAAFDQMFRTHTIAKRYVAIVTDTADDPIEPGRLIDFLAPDPQRRDQMVVVARGGKTAITDIEVVAHSHGSTRVHLWPQTGRTHQLRVQCASRGHAILGDRLYGDADSASRLLLHAAQLDVPAFGDHQPERFDAAEPF